MTTNKYPEKTNLGGLWLMNPHAPRCHPSTNLDGANLAPAHQPQYGTTQHDHFNSGGTSWAGSANALPPAWRFTFPSSFKVLTGNTLPETGPFWEPFRGTHILRTQRYREKTAFGNIDTGDNVSHPRIFNFPLGYMPPINHVAWYDSLIRRVNTPDDVPPSLERDALRYPYRGFCWSLYFGIHPNEMPGIGLRQWYLVCGLEPNDNLLIGNAEPPFIFLSIWKHARPAAAKQEIFPSPFSGLTHARFNPLGKNVFRRFDNDTGLSFAGDDRLAAPYRSRYHSGYVARRANNVPIERPAICLEQIESTGFGCVVLRSAFLKAAPITHVGKYADYDLNFFDWLKSQGQKLLLDWTCEAEHLGAVPI